MTTAKWKGIERVDALVGIRFVTHNLTPYQYYLTKETQNSPQRTCFLL